MPIPIVGICLAIIILELSILCQSQNRLVQAAIALIRFQKFHMLKSCSISFIGFSLFFANISYCAEPSPAQDSPVFESPEEIPGFYRKEPVSEKALDSSISPKNSEDPDKVVNSLATKSQEWHEPSLESEEIYIQAIRQWLSSLPPQKRKITRRILKDAHPVMHSLRMAIRDKKAQLSALSFDQSTSPETLPRLGLELQKLKSSLKMELTKLGKRLQDEADVTMGPLGGETFWLAPPTEKADGSSPFSSIRCTHDLATLHM